jgi:putative peptide maturation system protein
VPFPLRGVQRMSEWDLVQVDGVPLLVSEAVEALELLWNEVRLLERIIDTCIIKGEIDRDPIDIDDDELQAGVDRFRALRGLGSVDATEQWLRSRGLTLGTLEAIVSSELRVRKLRQRVAGAEAERATIEGCRFRLVQYLGHGTPTATPRSEPTTSRRRSGRTHANTCARTAERAFALHFRRRVWRKCRRTQQMPAQFNGLQLASPML